MSEGPGGPFALTLYSRQDCSLCDEFKFALLAWDAGRGLVDLTVVDIDTDPLLAGRYGLRIPVLAHAGRELCAGHFRAAAVAGLTANA